MYVSDSTMTDLNSHLVYFPCLLQTQDANAESKDVTYEKGGKYLLYVEVAYIVGVCAE